MTIFALVDANNFYASCERVFRPELKGKPVVTLSSNDGCIIARSDEAKALGIKMGVPFFKVKEIIAAKNIAVFSSNFTFYGDMSARVMNVLAECVPEIEIYSIDEAFLLLDGYGNVTDYAKVIRKKVGQWTGIPVSLGIGPTKTIAKLANFIAKTHSKSGVFSLLDPALRERAYKKIAVKEVWGVGWRIAKRLNAMRIFTIADFISLDTTLVRKIFNVTLLKTQMELKGESCLSLAEVAKERKSLISSRSFGKSITELDDLRAAITFHVAKITHKLRKKRLAISHLYVYAYNNRFSKTETPRRFSCMVELPFATNSTGPLLEVALRGVNSIFEQGIKYKKAGIYVPELLAEGAYAQDLFTPVEDPKHHKLSRLMDEINGKLGKNQIYYGAYGTKRDWLPKDLLRSPHYTTQYNELLKIN